MVANDVKKALARYGSADDAAFLQRFFKTGKGQYGEGDVFIGVRVPMTRQVCKEFKGLPVSEIKKLIQSKVHEHRLAAVILLSNRFKKANETERRELYAFYLQALDEGFVNNWDIVDSSAPFIVGEYLWGKSTGPIMQLAGHTDLWHRRVAMLATFAFIKKGDPLPTLEIAKRLLHDPHDLIQKAVGWMLREVGKKISRELLVGFLEENYKTMPRTMLRYAIEHLPAEQKLYFMQK